MENVTNPFVETEDARRYQKYRPVYQDLPFLKLAQYLDRRIPRALDVACGTGHSTRALARIADRVVGCDVSEAMLNEARAVPGTDYLVAPAEVLPFSDSTFELLNITMAFHWTDQARFLTEAHRVVTPGGYLSVDCYGFTGEMIGNPFFKEPNQKFYRAHLPSVARGPTYPDAAQIANHGFIPAQEFPYEHIVPMNLEQFIGFIMTQSNFVAKDEPERTVLQHKMEEFYAESFGKEDRGMRFSGTLKLYRSNKS